MSAAGARVAEEGAGGARGDAAAAPGRAPAPEDEETPHRRRSHRTRLSAKMGSRAEQESEDCEGRGENGKNKSLTLRANLQALSAPLLRAPRAATAAPQRR